KVLEGPNVTTTIELDYVPPLPDLIIERPEQDQTLIAGRDSGHVDVQASLSDILPDSSLQAAILINGRPSAGAPVIDREARTITASVPLSAGENIIELKLWNKWNEGRTQRVANVRYLHLPSIDRVEAKNEQLPVLEL